MQYLASTPEGAWAEFLRHEEITDDVDLAGIRRALWVVEDDEESLRAVHPNLPISATTGGPATYPICQREAQRLRTQGVSALMVPSAALKYSTATGNTVSFGFRVHRSPAWVLVLFGSRPDLVGWLAAVGAPPPEVLARVHHLTD